MQATAPLPPHLLALLPALPSSQDWLRPNLPPVEELLGQAAWARSRSLARDRVRCAVTDEVDQVRIQVLPDEQEALVAGASYPLARAIIAMMDNRLVRQRFSVAEAKAASRVMAEMDLHHLAAVGEDLGLDVREGTDTLAFHVLSLLPQLRHIRMPEYRLVRLPLRHGWVELPRKRAARILEEAYRARVLDGLDRVPKGELAEHLAPLAKPFEAEAAALLERASQSFDGPVMSEAFPPCISGIINTIKAGENASHEARFAVVAFLHIIGMERDTIIEDLFSNVPDFARDITRYQVEHITGKKGPEAYTPPGCSTLQTNGLCPMMARKSRDDWHPLCRQEWMTHPLKFYRSQVKWLENQGRTRGGDDEGEKGTEEAGAESDAEGASEANGDSADRME